MLTRLRTSDGDWEWVIHWEELHDFPAGTYRFRVDGHHMNSSSERVEYQVTSDPFDLAPNQSLLIELDQQSGQISGRLAYPAATGLDFDGSSDDPGNVDGNFRMRHPRVPTGVAPPLVVDDDVATDDITIEFRSGGSLVAEVDPANLTLTTDGESLGGQDDVPVTRFSAPLPSGVGSGDYEVTVSVEDAHGNTGTTSQTMTF